MEDSCRQEVEQAVEQTEQMYIKVLKAAEETLIQAEHHAACQREFDDFRIQNETVQCWMKGQKQSLLSLSGQMPFEERLRISQVRQETSLRLKSHLVHQEMELVHLLVVGLIAYLCIC